MKKYFFLLIMGCAPYLLISQTYVNAYDAFNANHGAGYSYHSNALDEVAGSTGETAYLKSSLYMFKKTKDIKYLNEFVIHAKRVIERRDDNIDNIQTQYGTPSLGYPAVKSSVPPYCTIYSDAQIVSGNYYNITSRAWSDVEDASACIYYDQVPQQTGGICYPLSLFVYCIETDPDFEAVSNYALPQEAQEDEPSIGNGGVNTYQKFASWLEMKICESLSFEEAQWVQGSNGGAYHPYNGAGGVQQMNQAAEIGRALIIQYEYIYQTPCQCTCNSENGLVSQPDYLGHIKSIASYIKLFLQQYNTPSVYYWYDDAPVNNFSEDMVHAEAVMEFANLCYIYGLPDLNGNTAFTSSDMKRFANTLSNEFYQGPNYQYSGADGPYFSPSVAGLNPAPTPFYTYIDLDSYHFLINFNPYIYGILSDIYASSALYSPNIITGASTQLGFAELAVYENTSFPVLNGNVIPKNIFNPVAIGKPYPSLQWSSATSGDFGSGSTIVFSELNPSPQNFNTVNILSNNTLSPGSAGTANLSNPIHNITSGMFASVSGNYNCLALTDGTNLDIQYNNSGTFNSLFPSNSPFSFSSNFGGSTATLTSLHYNSHYAGGDDILAVAENGEALIYEFNNANPSAPYIMTNNQFANNIIGITSGIFDVSSNTTQIATVDYSGNLNIYSISITSPTAFSITTLYTLTTLNSNMQVNGFTSGDFDGSGADEIVLHSNYDGRYLVYKVKGGSIQEVASQAFPDGNYMADGSGNLNYFTDSQKWQAGNMTTIKSFSGSPGAVLVTSRNADDQVTIFDMQGECEGQNVVNDYFSNGQGTPPNNISPATVLVQNLNNIYSGTNNSYTFDYNAHNILSASNDIVTPGTTVLFTAGKEVDIKGFFDAKPGSNFVASIETNLACSNNGYFRQQNPTHNNQGALINSSIVFNDFLKSKTTDSLNANISPNPNDGRFILQLKNQNVSSTNEIFIYNDIGILIQHEVMNSSAQQFDLSSQPKGIYFVKVQSADKIFTEKVVIQ